MKKYINALYSDKLCAQAAAASISSFFQNGEISAKIYSCTSNFNSFLALKFILIGAWLGYITGAIISLFTEIYYFEILSVAFFLSGAVFGAISGTFTDLFLNKNKENSALITVKAHKENIYSIIKRLKKSRALEIYFTSADNL